MSFFIYLFSFIFLFSTCYAFPTEYKMSDSNRLDVLKQALDKIAQSSDLLISFSAFHIDSGEHIYINPSHSFPMASTAKLLFALTLLDLVDRGHLDLNDRLSLRSTELRPYSVLSKLFHSPDITLTLKNCLNGMMVYSENTLTDIIYHKIGGKKAINQFLKQQDLSSIKISRSILETIAASDGVPVTDDSYQSLVTYNQHYYSLTISQEEKKRKQFFKDTRDHISGPEFIDLLVKFYQKKLISETSTTQLLSILKRSYSGKNRLSGLLPQTTVYHKTGSFSHLSNDVGFILLPENKGTLVIAASVQDRFPERLPDTDQMKTARDNMIALLTKTVYDFFIFSSL